MHMNLQLDISATQGNLEHAVAGTLSAVHYFFLLLFTSCNAFLGLLNVGWAIAQPASNETRRDNFTCVVYVFGDR